MLNIKYQRIYLLIAGCLLSSLVCATEKISLNDLKITKELHAIRMTFDLNKECVYRCFSLENPDRLVVDLKDATLQAKISQPKEWLSPIIQHIRCSTHDKRDVRLVFDLQQAKKYAISDAKDKAHYHLFIDLLDDKKEIKSNLAENLELEKYKSKSQKNGDNTIKSLVLETPKPVHLPETPLLEAKPQSKNIVVVIDPGHGGKDPGAIGVKGTREKDVVLKISKQLQQLLNAEPGYRAILTRTTDHYISLRKRLAIARKNNPDMFVAIHADAYHHGLAMGASVYALSQRGATSEAAKWLAEKENESELGGLSSELADKDAILRSVLIDLSQTHTIEASLQIGSAVLSHLGKFTVLHHSKVEQAAFVVLKSPDIPSILVETGFLSNEHEENKLSDGKYQKQTAEALKQGIVHYFVMNPPVGSSILSGHLENKHSHRG